jgi:dihydrolipoamide dehydrogenase
MFKLTNKYQRFYSKNIKNFSQYNYDLIVVGGGPAGKEKIIILGYVASIKAAQKGLKTACIESRGSLGGTCLNVGCIPSKALLNISHKYHDATHSFKDMGIITGNVSYDIGLIMKKKEKVVYGLTSGIEHLFKKYKVDYLKGLGSFVDPHSISVKMTAGGENNYTFKNAIIATGSQVNNLPGGILPIDEKIVISSTGALSLQKVPKKMIVIGAGVIGLELGSVYRRFGSQVDVIEFADKILPPFDNEISTLFKKSSEKTGTNYY